MENIKKLLEETKAKTGVTSNNALARSLGIRRQRVTDYYNGDRVPDNDVCLKIAEVTGKQLADVIAAVQIDISKTETDKERWKAYFKSLGGIAAGFMLYAMGALLGVTLFVTKPAEALAQQGFDGPQLYTLQIMRLFQSLKRVAQNMLSTLVPRFYCPD